MGKFEGQPCVRCGSTTRQTAKKGKSKDCVRCKNEAKSRWRARNLERHREYNREYMRRQPYEKKKDSLLRNAYGITYEQLCKMREFQSGVCAVEGCEQPATDLDHCHSTGKVRELLCGRCNRMLPNTATPGLLRSLALYLEKHALTPGP